MNQHLPPANPVGPVSPPAKPSDAAESVTTPLMALLARGVEALEKLSDDPVIDVPVKPPICPNCERMNPFVRVRESEATGPLFEFVILCECMSCNEIFYALAEGWNCLADIEQLKILISERAELAGYEHSGKNQST